VSVLKESYADKIVFKNIFSKTEFNASFKGCEFEPVSLVYIRISGENYSIVTLLNNKLGGIILNCLKNTNRTNDKIFKFINERL